MQEIAAEAGVNQALLHYYFRSKARLAEAVFQRVAVRLFPSVVEVLGSDASIEDKVRQVVAIELDLMSRSPFLPAYVISEINQHPQRVQQFVKAVSGVEIDGVVPRVKDILDRQLKARARAGTMRPIPVDQFVVNLLSLCLFPFAARPMLTLALRLGEGGFERFIEQRKRELPVFFLNALRP